MTVVTKVWNYSGSVKSFTVPPSVLSVRWELWGAAGGPCFTYGLTKNVTDHAATDNPTGFNWSNPGGYVAGSLTTVPGDNHNLYVGGNGYGGTRYLLSGGSQGLKGGIGGWNGGGDGGRGYQPTSGTYQFTPAGGGGGGGGGTDLRIGGSALANRVLVAGGAGGAGGAFPTGKGSSDVSGSSNPSTPDPPYGFPYNGKVSKYISGGWGRGGYAGPTGQNGGAGMGAGGNSQPANAGGGATTTANGSKGVHSGSYGADGTNGITGVGGDGGGVTNADANNGGATCGGGGGGGGYRGGGGGSTGYGGDPSSPGVGGGGGGGSNFISGSFTATANKAHAFPPFAAGATGSGGFARVTYTQPPDAPHIDLPLNQSSIDATQALNVVFEATSPDSNATFTAYDVQWRLGAGSWTLIHVGPVSDAPTYTYTFAANFFTSGSTYDIQVRVYDQNNDVSAWSTVTITAVTLPAAPTITAPTNLQELNTTTINAGWVNSSGSPEVAYEVSFLDRNGSMVFDSGVQNANTRQNLCPNPSFEVDTSSWVVVGGTIAISTVYHAIGVNSGLVTWATNAAGTSKVYVPIATQPGVPYTYQARVTSSTATQPLMTLAAQNPTETDPFATGDQSVAYTAGTFQILNLSFIAQGAITWLVLIPDAGNTTAGALTYIDMVNAEIDGLGVPRTYFDGSNLNGNTGTISWNGTAGKSTSKLVNADVIAYTYGWMLGSTDLVTMYVKIATIASNGVFSDSAVRNFSINIHPPGTTTVTMSTNDAEGYIKLHLVAAAEFPPNVAFTTWWEIYRTDPRTGVETRLATNLVPTYVGGLWVTDYYDRTAGTEVAYTYRVRARSADGGFRDTK